MKLNKNEADICIPGGQAVEAALACTTHLGIGAHQDDLEIMAMHGVLECFARRDRWFSGVTCTNGSGSSRTGIYADHTDEEMAAVRLEEQRTAARIGQYAAILQLGYASKEIKDPSDHRLEDDLVAILQAAQPRIVYTHNPADKHATHVAVLAAAFKALRRLPPDQRPEHLYACEVWRDLDWVPDEKKTVLNVGGHEGLSAALVGVYDSQVAGGKRYDLATMGRHRANATYLESHATDTVDAAAFALDLTDTMNDESAGIVDHVTGLIEEFRAAVEQQLVPHMGS